MDRITHNQSFGIFAAATRILLLLATLGSGLAEATQPVNASALLGTWVNVKTTEGLVGVTEAQQQFALKSQVPDAPSSQRFWSMEKKIDVSIFAMQLTADAITTQRGLSTGFREVNPLLRPLVKRGVAGQTAATI